MSSLRVTTTYFESREEGIAQYGEIKLVLAHCLKQLIDFDKSDLTDKAVKIIADHLISVSSQFSTILYNIRDYSPCVVSNPTSLELVKGIKKEHLVCEISFFIFSSRPIYYKSKIRVPEGLFLCPKNLKHHLIFALEKIALSSDNALILLTGVKKRRNF